MLKRVDAETAEFEQCTTLLQAMRAVHGRMLQGRADRPLVRPAARRGRRDAGVDGRVDAQPRREEGLPRAVRAAARRCSPAAQRRNGEIREMLAASFGRLNAEFGFSLALGKPPDLDRFTQRAAADRAQLRPVPRPDARRCAWRSRSSWSSSGACWCPSCGSCSRTPAASSSCGTRRSPPQVDSQLRERAQGFKRRREALETHPDRRRRAGAAHRRDRSAGRSGWSELQTQSQRAGGEPARIRAGRAVRHRSGADQARPAALRRRRAGRRRRRDAAPGLSGRDGLPAGVRPRGRRWQREHGRHGLPWQGTRDPYRVWLSEVMLQQTQVATVLGLLRALPRPLSRRAAPWPPPASTTCWRLWSGLGYYSRARNLHRCAQVVVAEHGGEFPRSSAALATLPGHRPLDRRGDRRVLFRRAGGDPRRQRQARADARARVRRRPGRGRRTSASCGRRPPSCCRRAASRPTPRA